MDRRSFLSSVVALCVAPWDACDVVTHDTAGRLSLPNELLDLEWEDMTIIYGDWYPIYKTNMTLQECLKQRGVL